MKTKYLFVWLLLNAYLAGSQNLQKIDINRKIDFYHHLKSIGDQAESLFLLQSLINDNSDYVIADSLHVLAGWQYYSMKELSRANSHFLKVSSSSSQFYKARFFSAYNYSYLSKLDSASFILGNLKPDSPELNELKNFETGGIALLSRNFELFEQCRLNFSGNFFSFSEEEMKLIEYAEKLMSYKPKSPAIAALLSTLFPGAGKVYAGKIGEGISSFLIVSTLGLISYENYRKDGIYNFKTILFSGITSIYYGGNIVGSYYSAIEKNKNFYHVVDQKILFDIHIPLRSFFE
jgi:hypothetical protein